MENPIMPTVGRIVLINPSKGGEVVPAIVTKVHSRYCINATVFMDREGPVLLSSILYTDDFENSGQPYGWHWMEYQKAQAARAEA